MKTKIASAKPLKTAVPKTRVATVRASVAKVAVVKSRIGDPGRRYVMEHWGELGKDYKLDY